MKTYRGQEMVKEAMARVECIPKEERERLLKEASARADRFYEEMFGPQGVE